MGCKTCQKTKIRQAGDIITGFTNLITGTNNNLYTKRISICIAKCTNTNLKELMKVNKNDSIRYIYQCTKCGCILDAKTRVTNINCCLNYW